MNSKSLAIHYERLTAEERFRLIVAAGARGDEVEQSRLKSAGRRITLSMQDHAPHAHAFEELAMLMFIELLEEAGCYDDAFHRAYDVADSFDDEEGEDLEDGEEEEDEPEDGDEEDDDPENGDEGEVTAQEEPDPEEDRGEQSMRARCHDLILGRGFVLKTKAAGWQLFCERLNIPPFAHWEQLPGFDRLQRALELAETAAFYPEGMVRCLNRIRASGRPEATETNILTAQGAADGLEKMFRERAKWWGGKGSPSV